MKQHQRTIGKNDEWLTPPEILTELGAFDLDPCAPSERPWPTATRHLTCDDDGLGQAWSGRVWCNPPFNRYDRPKWMRKMSEHGDGILLVPAATETEAFDQYVWQRADAVCFVKTRPHFHFVDGRRAKANCGTAIALVAYGQQNVAALERSNLGKTVKLTLKVRNAGAAPRVPHHRLVRQFIMRHETEREYYRRKIAEKVTEVVGPLLDAWDIVPNDVKAHEELSAVAKHMKELDRATDAEQWPESEAYKPNTD